MPGGRGQTVAFSRSGDGTAVPGRAVFTARVGSAAGLAPRAGSRYHRDRAGEAGAPAVSEAAALGCVAGQGPTLGLGAGWGRTAGGGGEGPRPPVTQI